MKKRTNFLLLLLVAPHFVISANAQLTFEASTNGSYTYFVGFENGYGFSLDSRLVTESQHKLGIGIGGGFAEVGNEHFRYVEYAPPGGTGYWYTYPADVSGDMNAWTFEIAPMFKLNKSNVVRNYFGLGLDLVFLNVHESGEFRRYRWDDENQQEEIGDTISYSFDAHGNAPGFRFFFETQWFLVPRVAATFGFGFKYASINKVKVTNKKNVTDYIAPGNYHVGGFYYYVGVSYIFGRLVD